MKKETHRHWLAFGGCFAVGGLALASSIVLAVVNPSPEDVGQSAASQYVASIEQNDIVGACSHARRAAELYLQTGGDATVGQGWQVIAQAVCPRPAVVAGLTP